MVAVVGIVGVGVIVVVVVEEEDDFPTIFKGLVVVPVPVPVL
jgi:hypothetical protein